MVTLILPQRYTPDSVALWQAAINEGWATQRLQSWRIQERPEGAVIVYGEHLFAITIAEQLNLKPLRPPLNWLTHLPSKYLKRQIRFLQLATITEHALPAFIKPADDKCFPAKVYENAASFPDFTQLSPQTPILISEPAIWQVEFRAFILNRNLATFSIYARNGQTVQNNVGDWPASPGELAEAMTFIQELLADSAVNLPPSVVLDVGIIQDRS